MKTSTPASGWGRKAEALYQPSYAREYRRHDEELDKVAAYEMFCSWLRDVSLSFGRTIDVLDLGCGTGRYFCAVSNASTLVGLDASAAMIEEARHPVNAERITAGTIDLVYSIGVLAEHTPLDAQVVGNVGRWTKPGGRFAFTTVHPDSPSVTNTWTRSMAKRVLPLTRGDLRRRLHDRLTIGGLYADETRIREVLAQAFTIESLTRVRSEAHLHGLCVARRNDA